MHADAPSAPIKTLELNERTIKILGRFRSDEHAFSFAARRPGYANVVVLGDHPWYWVVSPADGQRLERAGYELAPFPQTRL